MDLTNIVKNIYLITTFIAAILIMMISVGLIKIKCGNFTQTIELPY